MTSKRKPTGIWVTYKDGALHPMSSTDGLEDGESYFVKVDKKRHWPGHQAFMAYVREAWESLPDEERELFPSPDHFRKRMLIAAGFSITKVRVCDSEEQANIVASLTTDMINDDYCIVSVKGNVVAATRAMSQRMDAMDADKFKESCTAVQRCIEIMYGLTRETVAQHRELYNGR